MERAQLGGISNVGIQWPGAPKIFGWQLVFNCLGDPESRTSVASAPVMRQQPLSSAPLLGPEEVEAEVEEQVPVAPPAVGNAEAIRPDGSGHQSGVRSVRVQRPMDEGMRALASHINMEDSVREQQRHANRPRGHRVRHPRAMTEQTSSIQPAIRQQHQSSHAVSAYMFECADVAVEA